MSKEYYARLHIETRFWERVDKNGPIHPICGQCWVFKKLRKDGYGRFKINSKQILPHRYSYKLHYGSVNGLYVLHKCDNPSCVNPDHLFLGTHQDNVKDRENKNRGGQNKRRGENSGRSVLTYEDVLTIRKLYKPYHKLYGQKGLSKRYRVAESTINRVIRKKIWNDIKFNALDLLGGSHAVEKPSDKEQ